MMEFDGKDTLMQKISKNGLLIQKLQMYMQLALTMAQVLDPMRAQTIAMDMAQTFGTQAPAATSGGNEAPKLMQSDNVTGIPQKEHAMVSKARERAANASMPGGGAVKKEG